jgi:hypothetical protein
VKRRDFKQTDFLGAVLRRAVSQRHGALLFHGGQPRHKNQIREALLADCNLPQDRGVAVWAADCLPASDACCGSSRACLAASAAFGAAGAPEAGYRPLAAEVSLRSKSNRALAPVTARGIACEDGRSGNTTGMRNKQPFVEGVPNGANRPLSWHSPSIPLRRERGQERSFMEQDANAALPPRRRGPTLAPCGSRRNNQCLHHSNKRYDFRKSF